MRGLEGLATLVALALFIYQMIDPRPGPTVTIRHPDGSEYIYDVAGGSNFVEAPMWRGKPGALGNAGGANGRTPQGASSARPETRRGATPTQHSGARAALRVKTIAPPDPAIARCLRQRIAIYGPEKRWRRPRLCVRAERFGYFVLDCAPRCPNGDAPTHARRDATGREILASLRR